MLFSDNYYGCENDADEEIQLLCAPNQMYGALSIPFIIIRKKRK